MISLVFPHTLVRSFREHARKAFPNEYAAFILGKRLDSGMVAVDLWHPSKKQLEGKNGRTQIELVKEWLTQAMEQAASSGAIVLGNIHTHTYTKDEPEADPVQGLGDLQSWMETDLIAGVMNVTEQKSGRKRCGPLAFFGPTELVNVIGC